MKDASVFAEERRSSGKIKDKFAGTWKIVSFEELPICLSIFIG